jgi:hypothetical protein
LTREMTLYVTLVADAAVTNDRAKIGKNN